MNKQILKNLNEKYDYVKDCQNGLVIVGIRGKDTEDKYAVVNNQGEMVLPFIYTYISDFQNGLAKVYCYDTVGIINEQGDIVENIESMPKRLIPQMLTINDEKLNTSIAQSDTSVEEKSNESLRKKLKERYNYVGDFKSGLAVIANIGKGSDKESRYAVVNEQGEMIVPFDRGYTYISDFQDGLARAYWWDVAGIINEQGEEIVRPKYGHIGDFASDFILVRSSDDYKWGYINNQGKEVISLICDKAGEFENGIARVVLNGEEMIINEKGEIIETIKSMPKD